MTLTRTCHLTLVAACFLAASAQAQAQVQVQAKAQAQARDAVADLSALLRDLPARHRVPAVACALIEDYRLAGLGAAGVRKRGTQAPATAADKWHIGSCTKAMTATVVARLVEQGKLSWQTTLKAAFPQIAVHEDLQQVTLRHLLAHRSGLIRDAMAGDLWHRLRTHEGGIEAARALVARRILPNRPAFPPMAARHYSNTGYIIAGALVERATGKSWERTMGELLFAPLGMKSAGFGAPGARGAAGAAGARGTPGAPGAPGAHGAATQPWGHTAAGEPVEPGPNADNPPALGPAGTVHLTLADWSAFIVLHLHETDAGVGASGTRPLLQPATIRRLHEPVGRPRDYALGWSVTTREWAGGRTLTHNGSNTMWFAVCWLAPAKGIALLAACNQGGSSGSAACDAACAAMLQELARKETARGRKR